MTKIPLEKHLMKMEDDDIYTFIDTKNQMMFPEVIRGSEWKKDMIKILSGDASEEEQQNWSLISESYEKGQIQFFKLVNIGEE